LLPDHLSQTAKRVEARRGYISEAFHSFNQPLTALHCGLELCLLKERSPEEYRERIADALENAGTVLQLSKAVRELVEAVDPGEELQSVELQPALTALSDELAIVAEAAVVGLKLSCQQGVAVFVDPSKLTRHLGNLGSIIIRALEPGGTVQLGVEAGAEYVAIEIAGKGKQRADVDNGLQSKIDTIRIDAANSYAWTLGGEFSKGQNSFMIRLAALK